MPKARQLVEGNIRSEAKSINQDWSARHGAGVHGYRAGSQCSRPCRRGAASAQEPVLISEEVTTQATPDCTVNDLGTLGSTPGSELEASGRWTTQDCDSRFRDNSDAHTYRFEVEVVGQIRIDLMSSEADSHVYLLDEDGIRISDDDDSGASGLNARIERQLQPGVYQVEATTTGGRSWGPADFNLTVMRLAGCEPTILGALTPGEALTATGYWSNETCDSIFLTGHPSNYFTFSLPQGARVRVDLVSETGDPILVLAPVPVLTGAAIGKVLFNDDSSGTRNSRLEQFLPAEVYAIEASTYRTRDLQRPLIDFTLTVTIVDEQAHQRSPQLKIEEIDIPTEVVAGDPFPANFRVGNVGGSEFPGGSGHAITYVFGPQIFERSSPLVSDLWPAGASYHTSEETASATSTDHPQVVPHSVTFNESGPTWVFVAVIAFDGDDEELGFHGLWHNLLVLSGPTYDSTAVEVDGVAYSVSAEADEDGLVTTSVTSVADPAAEVDVAIQEKAQYAAGVRTQLIPGIFERSAIAGLDGSAEPAAVTVTSPSSSALLKALAENISNAVDASGLAETTAIGEAISPIAAEELVLSLGNSASAEYASIAATWQTLLERFDGGGALSFEEARAVQAQVVYVENVIAPAVAAGESVGAARAAELGWDDSEIMAALSDRQSCYTGEDRLGDALAFAGLDNAEALLALDGELSAALFAYIAAIDHALCEIESVDAANSRFVERLGLDHSDQLLELIEPEALPEPELEPEPASPRRLRIMARLGDDGRIEHGVELFSGFQALPTRRFLPADTQVDMWYSTEEVELDESSIGQIRARRLDDGRVELGFRNTEGEIITPDIAFLPADPDEGVWYRSSLIDVPVPPEMDTEDGTANQDG